MSLTNDVRNNILDALNGVDTFDAATLPLRLRLLTANGNATTAGVELATGAGTGDGAGYTAGGMVVTFGAATSGAANPLADLRWDNMPPVTIVGAEIWDSTPRRVHFAPLTTPRPVGDGESFELAADDVTETLV
jgi:hypothetical protein